MSLSNDVYPMLEEIHSRNIKSYNRRFLELRNQAQHANEKIAEAMRTQVVDPEVKRSIIQHMIDQRAAYIESLVSSEEEERLRSLLPVDSKDARPIIEIYEAFFPSANSFSLDIHDLLCELLDSSKPKYDMITSILMSQKRETKELLWSIIFEDWGLEYEHLVLSDIDDLLLSPDEKSDIIEIMINQRKHFLELIHKALGKEEK